MGCWKTLENEYLVYPSDKVVKVKNWRLALFWVLLQVAIFLYIIVYSIVLNKGYQRFDTAIGSLNFKAKGLATTHKGTPYDSVDLVYPSLENDAFFLATSFLRTQQTQVLTSGAASCLDYSSPCPAMACQDPNNNNQDRGAGLGRLTGDCTPDPTANPPASYCSAIGWCPLEDKSHHGSTQTTLEGIDQFTLQITLRAYFPLLDSPQKFSIFGAGSGFHQEQFPSISELMNLPSLAADFGGNNLNNTLLNGAVVLLMVNFDCNLDKTANCSTSFQNVFVPIDSRFKFRAYTYATVPKANGTGEVTQRTMFTYTGIRVLTVVGGRAGAFNFGAFATTIGAGIGLLSVAGLVTDFAMKRCFPNRRKYMHATEDIVTDKEMDEHPTAMAGGVDLDTHQAMAMERVSSLDTMAKQAQAQAQKQSHDEYHAMH